MKHVAGESSLGALWLSPGDVVYEQQSGWRGWLRRVFRRPKRAVVMATEMSSASPAVTIYTAEDEKERQKFYERYSKPPPWGTL